MARRRQGSPCTNGNIDSDDSKGSPKSNENACQHCGKKPVLTKGINYPMLTRERFARENLLGRQCKQCKAEGSSPNPEAGLYMCLKCGQFACDDSGKNHAPQHYAAARSEPHFIGLHMNDWTIRCFRCNEELDQHVDKKLPELVVSLKTRISKLSVKQEKALVNSNGAKDASNILEEDSSSNSQKKKLSSSAFCSTKSRPFGHKMRVRGLSNLGNTCFFNSVLQCLAQTPFLEELLREIQEPDEEVILPEREGEERVKLVLGKWGPITEALANTLHEITTPGTAGSFAPRKLLDSLRVKCPQFQGFDQHDSHELLRHLLECVRVEDLKRYQKQIFAHNGLTSKVNPNELDEKQKEAIKKMNTRITDTVTLRPEHLFKGTLVSTLTCKSCNHVSQTEERFLDLSLPITGDKPMKKAVEHRNNRLSSKNQRLKRKQVAAAQHSKYFSQLSPENGQGDSRSPKKQEESDSAELEDNEDSKKADGESGYSSEKPGSTRVSPIPTPNTPENMCSVTDNSLNSEYSPDSSVNPFENGVSLSVQISPIPLESTAGCGSPDSICANASPGSPSGFDDLHTTGVDANSVKSKLSNLDFSAAYTNSYMSEPSNEFYKNHDQLDSISEFRENYDQPPIDSFDLPGNSEYDNNNDHDRTLTSRVGGSPLPEDNGLREDSNENSNDAPLNNSNVESPVSNPPESEEEEEEDSIVGPSNFMTYSRFQYNDTELSVTSCLNQFTALETLSGGNKVSCENCAKVQNKGKTEKAIYSNASKQFLIRSPPAVLILHLKRFQVMYTSFQKIHRFVSFPLILDIDPYCSEKCRKEWRAPGKKEISYSLYGVVVHSGCLGGGHYIAYVKARSPPTPDDERLKFFQSLKNPLKKEDKAQENNEADTEKEQNGSRDSASPELDQEPQWYYISDSHVTQVSESDVLKCEAYLLFYERIV